MLNKILFYHGLLVVLFFVCVFKLDSVDSKETVWIALDFLFISIKYNQHY